MHAYSQDLRERVLRALARGERPTNIARRLEVSRYWVYLVRGRLATLGLRTSLPMGGHRKSRLAGVEGTLRAWIKARPNLTLAEMCQRLSRLGIAIKGPALWHQLDKWGLTFKKNAARHRAGAQRRAGQTAQVEETSACSQEQQAGFPG